MKRSALFAAAAICALSFNACEQHSASTLPAYYQEGAAHGHGDSHGKNDDHSKGGYHAKPAEAPKHG